MSFWRGEYNKEVEAHKKSRYTTSVDRHLIDVMRAFLRKKELGNEFLEFLLSAHLGEEEAARIVGECRQEALDNKADVKRTLSK